MMARSRAALIHRRHCNCAKLRMSVFRSLARGLLPNGDRKVFLQINRFEEF
jgi:hypothetical protein